MSGLAALIRFDGGPAEERLVAAMLDAMAYRGPDGSGIVVQGPAVLGRLAMHASSAAETVPPLASGDGAVVAAFDGYLAFPDELRATLVSRGARLRSGEDAELVLAAYQTLGADFAQAIEGEFAAIIWDARRLRAVCLRDHHGLRPLYWHCNGQRLIVASEIAAVLAALPASPPLNLGYCAEVAGDEYYSADETVWQGVRRLLPAHVLMADPAGVSLSQYWALPTEVTIRYQREDDYVEHYREVLTRSVLAAARSSLPLACEVSGGLDSSSIFCLAQRLAGEGRLPAPGLRGYTLAGPDGSAASETEFARAAAAHAGITLAEAPLFMPRLAWFADRSAIDCDLPPLPNAAMSLHLDAMAVSDGCRVSLNGIGGDQWLDGTPQYYAEAIAASDWRLLLRCWRGDARALGVLIASRLLLRYGVGGQFPPGWRRAFRASTGRARPYQPPEWLQPAMRDELVERRARYEASMPADYRHSYKLRKLRHPIWAMVLDQAGRQRARSGLEMRSPMLSRRFIEFSAATPEHLRLRTGVHKYIHRRAMAGILPEVICQRESKAEFSAVYQALELEMTAALTARLAAGGAVCEAAGVKARLETNSLLPIDERYYGGLWGCYVVNLLSAP